MARAFTKMHGCGNDYIYFNCLQEDLPDPQGKSIALSDRRFGIGGDGIILIRPSQVADAQMRIYNADGSEAQMCGNGIRCVGKFLYDKGIVKRQVIRVETRAGIKCLQLTVRDGRAQQIRVDMGKAILKPREIPVDLPGESVIDREVHIAGTPYRITCVSMGNPHCVTFVEDVEALDLEQIGPQFEHAPLFPERINTEFIHVLDDHTLRMRVWERGSDETAACGTGACAAVVAAVENGYCQKGEPICVRLNGGELTIVYTDDTVTMTGGAVTVFEGTIEE